MAAAQRGEVAIVFYKLLGMLTWKAIRYYVRNNVPTRRIVAGTVVGAVGLIAVGAALRGHDDEG
jgi:hypothetical protein